MGAPKALLPHPAGGTFVDYVVRVAEQVADKAVLLGDPRQFESSNPDRMWLEDTKPDLGPLGGLISLLEYCEQGWTLLLSCDLPLLSPDLLSRLRAAATDDVDAVAVRHTSTPHSYHACCAAYHTRALEEAKRLIVDDRRMQQLLARLTTRVLEPTPEEVRALFNVNTPADLQRIQR